MQLPKHPLRPTLFYLDPKTGELAFFRRGKNSPVERLLEYLPRGTKEVFFFKFGKFKSRYKKMASSFALVAKKPCEVPPWIPLLEDAIRESHGRLQDHIKKAFNDRMKAEAKAKAIPAS